MTVYYKPPYDSPIEDTFARYAEKYLSQDVSMETQVEVTTICGNFRLDFVAIGPNGNRTAFECDGKEFHDESRDEWRDAMILGSCNIDEIYRISGKDITYRTEEVFYALSIWSPWLFDDRQKNNLIRLAAEDVVELGILPEETIFAANYLDVEDNQLNQLYLVKRHKNIPKGRRQFWQAAFKYAQSLGGGSLDEVMANYRKR
ncbi:hypothetical protein [Desulfoluna spongiiphila]|uniref:hypothetical protein n=1 Tax=Desulfoluna spongiiphila TaxID=419481 RepID=UPI0012525D25|nr:hypothetical protein [Desulfoluna spongiiphila]VVS92201.1 hypothetical protein DBB_17690 [Desulfoluna spongiiphila]